MIDGPRAIRKWRRDRLVAAQVPPNPWCPKMAPSPFGHRVSSTLAGIGFVMTRIRPKVVHLTCRGRPAGKSREDSESLVAFADVALPARWHGFAVRLKPGLTPPRDGNRAGLRPGHGRTHGRGAPASRPRRSGSPRRRCLSRGPSGTWPTKFADRERARHLCVRECSRSSIERLVTERLQRSDELGQSPVRVLLRHLHDELLDRRHHPRPAAAFLSAVRVRPLQRDEAAVPAQDRLRCHDGRGAIDRRTAERLAEEGASAICCGRS